MNPLEDYVLPDGVKNVICVRLLTENQPRFAKINVLRDIGLYILRVNY